jgi:hypothetical protein
MRLLVEKPARVVAWCSIVAALCFLPGCSRQMWYTGLRQVQAGECSKLQDNEREKCMQDAGMSYNRYQRERQDAFDQD